MQITLTLILRLVYNYLFIFHTAVKMILLQLVKLINKPFLELSAFPQNIPNDLDIFNCKSNTWDGITYMRLEVSPECCHLSRGLAPCRREDEVDGSGRQISHFPNVDMRLKAYSCHQHSELSMSISSWGECGENGSSEAAVPT